MWIHGARPGNPLFDLARSLNLTLSRRQNYNSGAIFTVDGAARTDLVGYSRVVGSWARVLEPAIRRKRAEAAAAANASSAAGAAAPAPVPDEPLAAPFGRWLAAERALASPQARRQANLLAHTRFQVLLNANASELSALRYGDSKTIPEDDVVRVFLWEEGGCFSTANGWWMGLAERELDDRRCW